VVHFLCFFESLLTFVIVAFDVGVGFAAPELLPETIPLMVADKTSKAGCRISPFSSFNLLILMFSSSRLGWCFSTL